MIFSPRRFIDDLTRRHPTWVTAAVIVSSGALLATSPASPDAFYKFSLAGPMAHVELTETAPSAVVHVNVRALRRGAHDIDTTFGATVRLNGTVRVTGIDQAPAPSVSVLIDTSPAPSDEEVLDVTTSFSAERPLVFVGDCRTFSAENPCVSSATVELSRSDAGTSGGVVTVEIAHNFAKSHPKGDDRDEHFGLPWAVEVTTE